MPLPTPEEVVGIKERAAPALLAVPGVVAVGLGSKEVGGDPTGQLVIKVYVRDKRPASELTPDELIPREIEGMPTDVVIGGDQILVSDPPGAVMRFHQIPDGTRYRPLTGGARIAPEGSNFQGTMGCLLRHTTDPNKVYALTCEHVIRVPDVSPVTAGTTKAGQPSGIDSCTDCCDDLIGTYAAGGRTVDRDEALVQLSPGMQWQAEIVEIGVVRGKHTVTPAEAQTGTYKVRKRGARTELTGGVISAVGAATANKNNVMIVRPNPNPSAGRDTVFFAYEIDSGSALVNEANEVVGLVYARDNVGLGYALPIDGVLSRFASVEALTVDVVTATTPGVVNTVPGAAMAALPPEVAPALAPHAFVEPETAARTQGAGGAVRPTLAPVGAWLAGTQPDLAAGVARVQQDLDRSRTGRMLIGLWLEHQQELLELVTRNRRVATVWHRSGAAALFQLMIRMLGRPDIALPPTVNGQPLAQCIDRLRDVLSRFASARLRADLQRIRDVLPDLGGLTYPEIIAALDHA